MHHKSSARNYSGLRGLTLSSLDVQVKALGLNHPCGVNCIVVHNIYTTINCADLFVVEMSYRS